MRGMRSPCPRRPPRQSPRPAAGLTSLLGLATALAPHLAAAPLARAAGEVVREIRVEENVRTSSDSVRALAGIAPGTRLGPDSMAELQARLLDSRLFAEAHAYWEPLGGSNGARVTLVGRDRLPFVPVPVAVFAPGLFMGGAVLAHRNLLGAEIEGHVAAQVGTDLQLDLELAAPRLLGGWLRPRIAGALAQQDLLEYGNAPAATRLPERETRVQLAAGDLGADVYWWRRLVTGVVYRIEGTRLPWSHASAENPDAPADLPPAAAGGLRTAVGARVGHDSRVVEGPLRLGQAILLEGLRGSSRFGGDRRFEDLRLTLDWEYGQRVLTSHNFLVRAGAALGFDQPLWHESTLRAFHLRGVRDRRYRGDTLFSAQVEHHVPLATPGPFVLRGLIFADAAAVWWGRLPARDVTRTVYDERRDGRQFLPVGDLTQGFSATRDLHASAGLGLRMFLHPLTVPIVGVDLAYAFREQSVGVLVTVGR